MFRVLLGVLVSVALAGSAAASPAIQRGGPKRAEDRARLERSLDKVAGALAVCWRGNRPDEVHVTVDVSADGSVESAKANTKGKVATCAAAVLAVQQLAKAGKGYRATVVFPTAGGGGSAAASTRDRVMAAIKDSSKIAACRGKSAAGRVDVRFLIKPKGRIVDVEIVESTVSDKSVGTCFVKAVRALELDLDNAGTLEFVMPFTVGAKAPSGGEASAGGDASLQPTKKGPIETSELAKVMHASRGKFTACYEKQAAKDRSLAGDVVLRYTVRADGTTRNVKIKRTTLNNAAVENCIVGVGEKLQFSNVPGRKETRVVYPFRFSLE